MKCTAQITPEYVSIKTLQFVDTLEVGHGWWGLKRGSNMSLVRVFDLNSCHSIWSANL